MKRYKYDFCFADNSHLTFETNENIDFHTISNTAIAFPEIYINMGNVNCITKEEKDYDSVSGDDSSESENEEE